jgi:copper chaperone CopZ
MNTHDSRGKDRIARSSLLAAMGAGLLASVCCVGPLAAVAVGVGGAWAGQLSALEPYRPFFVVLALGALGLAWYREVRPQRASGRDAALNCDCEAERRPKMRRLLLSLVTVLVLGVLALPSLIGQVQPAQAARSESDPVKEVVLQIEGMTCASCAQAVVYALQRLEGVQQAKVTFEPPIARVRFEPAKVSVAQLIAAVEKTGFKAMLKVEGES